jgi:hypothetical protein
MRRKLVILVGLYLLLAGGTWAAEALGLGGTRFRCACEGSCWCKQPGLALFRWVTPGRWHRIGLGPDEKRAAEVTGGSPDL